MFETIRVQNSMSYPLWANIRDAWNDINENLFDNQLIVKYNYDKYCELASPNGCKIFVNSSCFFGIGCNGGSESWGMSKVLESSVAEINRLAASTEKLASAMEEMLEEQKEQGKRIAKLEGRDGEKWRSVVKIAATVVIGAVIGALLAMIGLN